MLKFGYPWNQGHLENTSIESLWLGFDDNHWFLFAGTLRSTLSSTLIWHLAQAIEKLLDTNWSCCNSVSGKVVTATCVCCHQFFRILYQSMICGQEMLKTCVVTLFYWCLCTLWQNSSNCIIKFHQAGFHSNKVYPLKNKHGTQTWRFGRWLFSFSKGGDFGLFGRERCFLHWNRNHLSGFAKTVMTSPGCQKSRWLQTKLRTSRRHTRKAEMECPPSSCWQIPDGRKIHPQRLGSNFFLQKIQLLKVPYRLRR